MESRTIEMDLFSRTCLDLGSSFILIKRIDWIISSTVGSLRIIFAAIFLLLIGFKVCQRFQKKMEVYCDDFYVWDFIPAFLFFSAN
jgi:hypothetical protein